jgi:GAF domain-containing protein
VANGVENDRAPVAARRPHLTLVPPLPARPAESGVNTAPAGEWKPAIVLAPAPAPEGLTEVVRRLEDRHPELVCAVLAGTPGERLRVVAAPSLSDDLVRALEGIEAGVMTPSWVGAIRERRVIVEDTAIDSLWARSRRLAREHGLRSSLAEPIRGAHGRPLGALIAFRHRVHRPDAAEQELLAEAARQAAAALERDGSPADADPTAMLAG